MGDDRGRGESKLDARQAEGGKRKPYFAIGQFKQTCYTGSVPAAIQSNFKHRFA